MTTKMITMDDCYGDGSSHRVCEKCGLCIICEDCKCGKNKMDHFSWLRLSVMCVVGIFFGSYLNSDIVMIVLSLCASSCVLISAIIYIMRTNKIFNKQTDNIKE